MVSPIYGDPSYRIFEFIGSDIIGVRIEILDFKRFAEKILSIKDGGSLTLEKIRSDKRVDVTLINLDSGSIKTLGDKT